MADLKTSVWTRQLMEKYYSDASFLTYAQNMSTLVNNDKINLAEAGVDPNVLINNSTYPIPVAQRSDIPLEIELDKFETENTLVRRPEVIEYSYDQMESVLRGHRMALQTFTGKKAAHAFAPQQDTTNTPVLSTSGANDGSGNKMLTPSDILDLKLRYDDLDYPIESRYLVLAPRHVRDLINYDLKSFKDITDITNGQPKRFGGFNILQFTKNPVYNRTTMQKKSFEAVATGTDAFCSFSFAAQEVMCADGQIFMYSKLNDPELRGSIVGFDKRFVALPLRNKGVGAIVSAAV